MLRATQRKGKVKRATRLVGICAAARTLNVERTHLYRVLRGQRKSRSLLQRYRALKSAA